MRRSLGALRRPEACRAGTRIPPDLGLIRFYRTPVKKPEARGKNFASRLREMARGAGRRGAAAGKEPLGNPVLERMKGDDGKPAARLQQKLGGGEAARQLVKLLIEIEAQALKGAGGGVFRLVAGAAEHAGDDIGELARWSRSGPRRGA